jgi:hypothetical protein
MSASGESAPARDDRFTIAALGVIAACWVAVAHEAIGHGSECLLIGGTITRLTNVYFDCKGHDAFTPIAGPVGNLVCGMIAALLFGATPARRPRLKLLFLLAAAFSLFWEAGYMLYAAAKGTGDYMFFLENIGVAGLRPVLVASGLLLYLGAAVLTARGVYGFGAGAEPTLAARARRLLWPAWIAGGLAETAAAALYAPGRLEAMHQAALEIGAAAIPLLIIPFRLPPGTGPQASVPAIGRSLAWIGTAAVVFLAFAATLGRGLP